MSNKQFVFMIGFTFIVVIVWIIADVLHTRPSVPPNPHLTTILEPINPNFDQKALDEVKDTDTLNQYSINESISNSSASLDLAKQPASSASAAKAPIPTPLPISTLPNPIATSGGIQQP